MNGNVDLFKLSKEQLINLIIKNENKEQIISHRNIELEALLKELKDENEALRNRNLELEELQKLYILNAYCKHRKTLPSPKGQIDIFEELEIDAPEAEVKVTTTETKVEAYVRRHVKKIEHISYDHLIEENKPVHMPEEDILCPICGSKMSIYKYKEYKELVYIPAKVKVTVHRVPCYICHECVDDHDHNPCVCPDLWKPLFPHSICSASLLASLIDYKYDLGLPFNTIERNYRDNGIVIPHQNMANWLIESMKYLEPLYNLMHKDLLKCNVIAADETTMQVINEEGRTANQISYLWQYQNTIWDDNRIIMYEYTPGRSGKYAANFLHGFKDNLVTDKYPGYFAVGATRCYCHIHAMRYIREAYEILAKDIRNQSLEYEAYQKYQNIFSIDNKIHSEAQEKYPNNKEEQLKYVQKNRSQTKEAFEEFLSWLEGIKEKAMMKPSFLKAINYMLTEKEGFLTFMNDPKIPLGNNECEISFKPFILTRQRSKFFTSTKGAQAAAKIYSLIITAKKAGLTTYSYFNYVFEKLPYIDMNNEDELRKYLPYSNEIPDYCKLKNDKEIRNKIKELEKSAKNK